MGDVVSIGRARMTDIDAGGFIKLHRSIQDSAFKRDPERFSLWVHMLLEASHKPFRTIMGGRTVIVEAGQFISGNRDLEAATGVSIQRIKTSIKYFETEGMITRRTGRHGTVFTVLNYADFQGKNGEKSNPPATRQINPQNNPSINPLKASSEAASGESSTHQSTPASTHHQPAHLTRIQEDKNKRLTDTNVSVVETADAESTVERVENQTADKPKSAHCPHAEIIEAYHEILPELQRVIPSRWTGTRATNLQSRWREDKRHQSIEFWRRFFTKLRDHKFYLGDNDRGWRADLGWILKRGNFDKLLEKFVTDSQGPRHA
jgi:hypothetical protein